MNIVELKKAIISPLAAYAGSKIIRADNLGNKPEEPHATYKITMPYGAGVGYPEEVFLDGGNSAIIQQTTEHKATFSFTAYAMKEDESILLAQKIHEWFSFYGYDIFDNLGVTIIEQTDIANRDAFVVENYERRNGFDVIIKYMDVKTREVDWFEQVDHNFKRGEIK